MCPHVLGWKDDRERGLFYQYGGESESGLSPLGSAENWRCMFIDEMSRVRVVEGPWRTAFDGLHGQTCIDEVDVSASS